METAAAPLSGAFEFPAVDTSLSFLISENESEGNQTEVNQSRDPILNVTTPLSDLLDRVDDISVT